MTAEIVRLAGRREPAAEPPMWFDTKYRYTLRLFALMFRPGVTFPEPLAKELFETAMQRVQP